MLGRICHYARGQGFSCRCFIRRATIAPCCWQQPNDGEKVATMGRHFQPAQPVYSVHAADISGGLDGFSFFSRAAD